jgi:hypothetical protein
LRFHPFFFPDKPERIATKAPEHKEKLLVNIHLKTTILPLFLFYWDTFNMIFIFEHYFPETGAVDFYFSFFSGLVAILNKKKTILFYNSA